MRVCFPEPRVLNIACRKAIRHVLTLSPASAGPDRESSGTPPVLLLVAYARARISSHPAGPASGDRDPSSRGRLSGLPTPEEEGKMQSAPYDAAGHRRSPVTMPGFHAGRAPRNKGHRYPADPPTVEEIVAVMRQAGTGADGARLRALIVILRRAGLRIGEALDLAETDLDASRGAVLVRRGKGGRRREVGMDRWAWSQLEPWIATRRQLPVGALLCVVRGATAGHHWESSSARKQRRAPPIRRACAVGSHRISSVTRTRWRWRTRACRWWSSSASSGTRASGSRPFTCRDRQLGDHSHRPRPAGPSDPGDRWPWTSALTNDGRVGQ